MLKTDSKGTDANILPAKLLLLLISDIRVINTADKITFMK
jgi:hypothetical protein